MKKCEEAHSLARRTLALALVAAITALAMMVLSFLFQPKNNQAEFGMIEPVANGFLGERANIDVLFVGDSEVYSAISPLQLWDEQGVASYNASNSAQRLPYAFTLLKRASSQHDLRLVVFETNSFYRSFTLGDGLLRLAQDFLPLLEYHNRWKSLTDVDFTMRKRATWTDDFKGYRMYRKKKSADDSRYALPSRLTKDVPQNNRLWISAMVKFCRRNDIIPVFVTVPSTVNWNMSKHNGLQSLADELGVDYLDLNLKSEETGINWKTDSKDGGDHLNYRGAKKVTSYLGSMLLSKYRLPDHREDAAYSMWDKSFQRYLDSIPAWYRK